jgi:hypothetical protein
MTCGSCWGLRAFFIFLSLFHTCYKPSQWKYTIYVHEVPTQGKTASNNQVCLLQQVPMLSLLFCKGQCKCLPFHEVKTPAGTCLSLQGERNLKLGQIQDSVEKPSHRNSSDLPIPSKCTVPSVPEKQAQEKTVSCCSSTLQGCSRISPSSDPHLSFFLLLLH